MGNIMESKVKLTILGSGTCVPSLTRSSCSGLVEFGDNKILLDMGAGTMRRLLEAGVSPHEITMIFFSHLHPDHIAELTPFLFSSKYGNQGKVRKPFIIVAGRGFQWFYDNLQKAFGHWIVLDPGIMTFKELDNFRPDKIDMNGFSLSSCPVDHSSESVALRINMPAGKSLVYSGDTDYCDDLIELADGTDILLCECAMPNEMKTSGHLTPSEAGNIARKSRVKHLVLTHFYPECEEVDIIAQCKKNYDGKITEAVDLMKINI